MHVTKLSDNWDKSNQVVEQPNERHDKGWITLKTTENVAFNQINKRNFVGLSKAGICQINKMCSTSANLQNVKESIQKVVINSEGEVASYAYIENLNIHPVGLIEADKLALNPIYSEESNLNFMNHPMLLYHYEIITACVSKWVSMFEISVWF